MLTYILQRQHTRCQRMPNSKNRYGYFRQRAELFAISRKSEGGTGHQSRLQSQRNHTENICKDGARVQAGQLLAELDPTDYQVQLDATEAEYKQIKAEAERVMALYKDNGTTPSANDKAVYGLKQITAKYQHHKDQLGYTRLYAPFSGYIQKRLFEAHETIGAGMPVLSMISSGAPEVEINLPAAEYIRREQFDQYTVLSTFIRSRPIC